MKLFHMTACIRTDHILVQCFIALGVCPLLFSLTPPSVLIHAFTLLLTAPLCFSTLSLPLSLLYPHGLSQQSLLTLSITLVQSCWCVLCSWICYRKWIILVNKQSGVIMFQMMLLGLAPGLSCFYLLPQYLCLTPFISLQPAGSHRSRFFEDKCFIWKCTHLHTLTHSDFNMPHWEHRCHCCCPTVCRNW